MNTLMSRRKACALGLSAAVAACCGWAGLLRTARAAEPATAPRPRPNILYIMSDDHAAHAIGAYGGPLAKLNPTPNIDRLAQQGLRFNHVYATNSICTPSRACILTGQYSHMNGVPVFNAIDPARPVVSKYLQQAGYHTVMIGKWHLGTDPQGFDSWEILPGQGAYNNPLLYTKDGEKRYTGHVTDVITDLALQALANRPKDRPFFAMIHHKAPHRNWIPRPQDAEHYRPLAIPEPPTLFDDYATRSDALRQQKQSVAKDLTPKDLKETPPAGLEGEALVRWKYQRYMHDYLACIRGVDESVGRLLEYLDKNGLADNTVVIYTSDQGFFLGDHGLFDKRFMYEESDRMPVIVRYPGVIRPGTTCDALAINCDFAPTFLDLAGAPIPADMQGRSLRPLFSGQKPADWRTSFYYRYYDDPGAHNTRVHYGVRTDTHKLIYFWTLNQWECFDLTQDPQELHNLYADPAAQETVRKLKDELYRLKKELGDTDQFSRPEDQAHFKSVDGPRRAPAKAAAATTAAAQPNTLDVVLQASGNSKIQVIKVVRAATGLGLKDAKNLVDNAPKVVRTKLNKEEAERLKKELEAVGAQVELK